LKKRIFSAINYLFFLLIGVLLLWLVFRKVDLHQVVKEILEANYFYILLAIIAAIISHIFRAARWNLMIGSMGYPTRLSTTFYAVMIGYLANTAVPRLGEISRCGALTNKDKIPFNTLFGTVIAERVFDMIILLLIILGVILFQLSLVGQFVHDNIIAPLFSNVERNYIAIIFFSVILAAGVFLIIVIIRRMRHHFDKWPFLVKMKKFGLGLVDGIKTIKRLPQKWTFVFYTFMIWLMYAFMVYFPFFAMNGTEGLDFGDAVTIMAIGSLGIVAPVPGGIGTYHFITTALLFELYGIDKAVAASFATLTHAAQTINIIILGAVSFLLILMQKRRMTDGNPELYQIQNSR